jgi:Flp pilus assembly protein TadD
MLNSNNVESYSSRGIAKARTGNIAGAILDFDVAIELNPADGEVYFNHGMAMEMSNDVQRACLDWTKADQLGSVQAITFLRKYCQ